MSGRPVTVCIKGARGPLFAASLATGTSVETLARQHGLTELQLFDPGARVPHTLAVQLWEQCAQLAANPHFGLFAAQLVGGSAFNLVDLALFNSESVAGMVQFFLRYQRMFHDANASRFEQDGGSATMVFHLEGELPRSSHLVEFVVATWLLRARRAVGKPLVPQQVRFLHRRPATHALPREVFGVEPEFGASTDALTFQADVMAMPVAQGNAELHALLRGQLDALAPVTAAGVVAELKPTVRELVLQGRAALRHAATRLAVSERSLQRRLQDAGTSFSDVVDDVRHELARAQLQAGNTVTDVAFALDFSDVSSFIRAFKRWTGAAPTAWLRAQEASAAR